MGRARNIGYIVLLAGAGRLAPDGRLKGNSALERTHYIHLEGIRECDRPRERTGERKTENQMKARKEVIEGEGHPYKKTGRDSSGKQKRH